MRTRFFGGILVGLLANTVIACSPATAPVSTSQTTVQSVQASPEATAATGGVTEWRVLNDAAGLGITGVDRDEHTRFAVRLEFGGPAEGMRLSALPPAVGYLQLDATGAIVSDREATPAIARALRAAHADLDLDQIEPGTSSDDLAPSAGDAPTGANVEAEGVCPPGYYYSRRYSCWIQRVCTSWGCYNTQYCGYRWGCFRYSPT